jgi:hypothetical protein
MVGDQQKRAAFPKSFSGISWGCGASTLVKLQQLPGHGNDNRSGHVNVIYPSRGFAYGKSTIPAFRVMHFLDLRVAGLQNYVTLWWSVQIPTKALHIALGLEYRDNDIVVRPDTSCCKRTLRCSDLTSGFWRGSSSGAYVAPRTVLSLGQFWAKIHEYS